MRNAVFILIFFCFYVHAVETHTRTQGQSEGETVTVQPTVTNGKNVRTSIFFPRIFSPEKKSTAINRIGQIYPKALETPRDPRKTSGVSGGEHITVRDLPQGRFAGSGGAGPCIGVLVTVKSANGVQDAHVFHFTATDNPAKTLSQVGPFPKGAHVAIFGGDNSESSNATLESVLGYFEPKSSPQGIDKSKPLILDGYSDTISLWIDSSGNYVRFPSDKNSDNEK